MKLEIEVTETNYEKVKLALDILFSGELKQKMHLAEDLPQSPGPSSETKNKRTRPKIQEAEELEENEEGPEEEQQKSTITIKELREKVAELAKDVDIREQIKDKLSELGAANVTKLDTSDYEEFNDFLETL